MGSPILAVRRLHGELVFAERRGVRYDLVLVQRVDLVRFVPLLAWQDIARSWRGHSQCAQGRCAAVVNDQVALFQRPQLRVQLCMLDVFASAEATQELVADVAARGGTLLSDMLPFNVRRMLGLPTFAGDRSSWSFLLAAYSIARLKRDGLWLDYQCSPDLPTQVLEHCILLTPYDPYWSRARWGGVADDVVQAYNAARQQPPLDLAAAERFLAQYEDYHLVEAYPEFDFAALQALSRLTYSNTAVLGQDGQSSLEAPNWNDTKLMDVLQYRDAWRIHEWDLPGCSGRYPDCRPGQHADAFCAPCKAGGAGDSPLARVGFWVRPADPCGKPSESPWCKALAVPG